MWERPGNETDLQEIKGSLPCHIGRWSSSDSALIGHEGQHVGNAGVNPTDDQLTVLLVNHLAYNCVCVCVCVGMYTCVCVCMYMYMYRCEHTYYVHVTVHSMYIVNSSRDDKLSERVKKSRKNGTQLGIEPRTF